MFFFYVVARHGEATGGQSYLQVWTADDKDNGTGNADDYDYDQSLGQLPAQPAVPVSALLQLRPNMSRDEVRSVQAGIMSQYMNRSAAPCHDFYEFACGNWHQYNVLPDDAAAFDTFEKLRDELHLVLRQLLADDDDDDDDSEATVKAKKVYKSCMDLGTSSYGWLNNMSTV